MADTVIKLRLNQQQLELMDRTIAHGVAPDRAALVRLRAARIRRRAQGRDTGEAERSGAGAMSERRVLFEHVLEPGTGKAHRAAARARSCASSRSKAASASTSTASTCTTTRSSCIAAAPAPCTASSDHGHLHVVGAAARARDALHPRRHGRPQRRAVSRAAAPMSTRRSTASPCTPTATTSRPRRSANTG